MRQWFASRSPWRLGVATAIAVVAIARCKDNTGPEYEDVAGTYTGTVSGTSQGVHLQAIVTLSLTQQSGGKLGGNLALDGTLSDGLTTLPGQGTGTLAGTIASGSNPSITITATNRDCPSLRETFSGSYSTAEQIITLSGTVSIFDATNCRVVLTYPNLTMTLRQGPPPTALTISVTGTGTGTVTSDPLGIACTSTAGVASGTCTANYNNGTAVRLTATPATGSVFSGWEAPGVTCSGTAPCVVTMDQARSVTATFVEQFTLRVIGAGSGTGTVVSDPAGITCTSTGGTASGTCTADYASGTSVTLTATAAAGSVFSGWSGAEISCPGTGPCAVTMDQGRSVTATFVQQFTLSVSGAGSGTGTVTAAPAGINCTSTAGTTTGTCTAPYASGTSVTLTATPAAGSMFTGWSGACTGTGSCVVNITGPRSVTATFTQTPRTLTVSVTGSGTVTSAPAGVSCPTDCTEEYPEGTSVTLNATPAAEWEFAGWSGACTGTGSCVVSMTGPRSVTATFTQTPRTLTVSVTGSGTVGSDPAGISCPTDCTEQYPEGTTVTLSATPAAGWEFAGWGGGACTGTGSCVVSMTESRSVTATFTQPRTLTVSVTGSGTVTSDPAGISCLTDCTEEYPEGTRVRLSATPAVGWDFAGWGGDCTGIASCFVNMTVPRSVTATFTQIRHILSVSVTGNGTVTSDPAGISCPTDCTENYPEGSTVTLVPTPASGWDFAGWSGVCTGTGSCVVNMTLPHSVTATFTEVRHRLTASVTGSGTVISDPAGISCPTDCSEQYAEGTSVTLTPTAATGWEFAGWSGACTGTGSCVLNMTGPRSLTATFRQIPTYTLTVTLTGDGWVESDPAGVSCPTDCTQPYPEGTTVTLRAIPATGWELAGWSGACTGTGGCVVSITGPRSVTATFRQIQTYTLTVTLTGSGGVESAPPGILCISEFSTICTASYAAGTEVTLRAATLYEGWLFGAWGGDCTGSGDCVVTMSRDRAVTATFVQPPSWIELAASGAPPDARELHTAVYDSRSKAMIIFGGLRLVSGTFVEVNDVWVLTNADGISPTPSWTRLFAAGAGPAARSGHSAVYDGATNRMIVFGGDGSEFFNDVWVLTNANGTGGTSSWTLLQPLGVPPTPRSRHAAVYDPGSNRMIVFGGLVLNGGAASNEVWVLTNANGTGGTPTWIHLNVSGLPPTARGHHSLVYDRSSNRMVVFGGHDNSVTAFNDTWVLTSANGLGGTAAWTQPSPIGSPPTARFSHSAVYDPSSNRMVVYGGRYGTQFDDVWVLKDANATGGTPAWVQLSIVGPSPAARAWHSAVYDPDSHRMTIFGGSSDGFSFRNDVWVFTNANGLP